MDRKDPSTTFKSLALQSSLLIKSMEKLIKSEARGEGGEPFRFLFS